MWTTTCKVCGNIANGTPDTCPKCGADLKKHGDSIHYNTRLKLEPVFEEPWRNEKGEIFCPGDSCTIECNMKCPVYINTVATTYVKNGEHSKAIELYNKAVRIALDFSEVWNNMASLCGGLGNFEEAYKYYKTAHKLSPEKASPLYGLALCCRDMGQYEEALKWCDEYEKVCSDQRTNPIRAFVRKKWNSLLDDEPDWYDTDEDDDLTAKQRYGKYYLMLLEEDTREEGYKDLEHVEKELPEAGIVLGQWYTAKGSDSANYHFKIAADAGIAEGLWGLATRINHSYVPNPDIPEDALWESLCLSAAEGECADAANELGNICNRRNCDVEAMYWYHLAYFFGKEDATISIRGITEKWIKSGKPETYKAGTANCTEKRFETSLIILKMYSGQQNNAYTHTLMEQAMSGDLLAGCFLASLYENAKNYEMTYKVYNMLAFTRSPNALRCYADLLATGRGVKQDLTGAFKYYEEAAEKGNAAAMFVMSQKALKDNDKYLAGYWAGAAYSRGYEPAAALLQKIKGLE